MRFVLRDTRIGENAVHLAAGNAPRIGVGDHDGAAAGKQLVEHLRRPRKGSDTDHQRFGVGRALKGTLYLIHNICLIILFSIFTNETRRKAPGFPKTKANINIIFLLPVKSNEKIFFSWCILFPFGLTKRKIG